MLHLHHVHLGRSGRDSRSEPALAVVRRDPDLEDDPGRRGRDVSGIWEPQHDPGEMAQVGRDRELQGETLLLDRLLGDLGEADVEYVRGVSAGVGGRPALRSGLARGLFGPSGDLGHGRVGKLEVIDSTVGQYEDMTRELRAEMNLRLDTQIMAVLDRLDGGGHERGHLGRGGDDVGERIGGLYGWYGWSG